MANLAPDVRSSNQNRSIRAGLVGIITASLLLAGIFELRAAQPVAACHQDNHQPDLCVPTVELPTVIADPPTNTPAPPDTPIPPTNTPVPPPPDTPEPSTSTPVPLTPTEAPPPPTQIATGTPTSGQPVPTTVDPLPNLTLDLSEPTTNPQLTPSSGTETPEETTDECGLPTPTVTPSPSDAEATEGISVEQDRIGCADPGTTVTYTQTIRNTSSLAQVVNVSTFSALAWDVVVYQSDGRTELVDSDGDGRVDVERVDANGTVDVVVAVSIPPDAPDGLHDVVFVIAVGAAPGTGRGNSATIRTAAVQG